MKNKILEYFNGDFLLFYGQYLSLTPCKQNGDNCLVLCPFDDHDDTLPSFSFNLKTGQCQCFGCKFEGDIFSFYAKLKELNTKADFPEILNQIATDFGIEKSQDRKAKRKLVKTYDYTNEAGKLLFQVCRYFPKDFRQRKPDDQGGWTWKLGSVERILYRLPQLLKSDYVIICEGEKDADRLAEIGLVATTNPGGAGKWEGLQQKYAIAEPLRDKDIIIIPDEDPEGRQDAQTKAQGLQGIAKTIKVLNLPGLPAKGDASDFVGRHNDPDEASEVLCRMIEGCKPWEYEASSKVLRQKPVEEHLSLDFPAIMSGVAGDFARIYGEHLEPPDHFFYMSYLTIFGLYVSDRLFLNSQRKPAPRLYTILLGESGDTRKSTAMEETERHFREFIEPGSMAICRGAASGEGLGKLLKKVQKVLLYYDELKVFVNKCNIKQSTLLMAANTLFEATRYENQTSRDPFIIDHGLISMLAASTTDTYAGLFDPKFLDIGFNNRLFLVPGDSDKCFPVPVPVPNDQIHRLYGQLQNRLKLIKNTLAMPIDRDAGERWADFYRQIKGSSPYSKRLDTYGLRLMPLLALNDLKETVDLEIIEKVITLIEWQHIVRRVYDPIDAADKTARMEENIRRALKLKPQWEHRALQRKVNYNRHGLWVWEMAKQNLIKNKELCFNGRKNTYTAIPIKKET